MVNDLFVKLVNSRRHTRNVCHYFILNFMCWGIEKKKLYVLGGGGNRKEDLCFVRREVRVNRENH